MKKNAFTLIEVLTVIVLLVTISLIAIFSISAIIKQSSENLYQLQIDSVNDASRTYAISHADNFIGTTQITICDLKRAGLLKDDFVNPKTDEKFDDSLIIEIIRNDSKTFSFNFDAETVMPNYACDLNGLGVTLIGASPYYVNLGETISIPGVKVVNAEDKELIATVDYDITFEDNIAKFNNRYSEVGQYYRKYTIIDKNIVDGKQFQTTITRIINVEDNTPPLISINGFTTSFTETILVGNPFSVPACNVTDNDAQARCNIVNNYDGKTNIPGTYDVIYTANDASGNTNTLVLTIIVKGKTKDLIGYAKLDNLAWTNQDITMDIDALYNKNSCSSYMVSYNNGYDWITKDQAISQNANKIAFNGTYRLGIKYNDSKCLGLDDEFDYSDYFEYEVKNIDKEAPTFYKNIGTPGQPNYKSEAGLTVTFAEGITNRIVNKSETINGEQVIHKYYYASGDVNLSAPTGATDNLSGVSSYAIYINGEKQNDTTLVLTADGKYVVELTATDFANNESARTEVAVVIIDNEIPVCRFALCLTNNECTTTKPAITGAAVSYGGSEYNVQLNEEPYQAVNYKLSCTDNYYVGEDDELEVKNFPLNKIQILGESPAEPNILSIVAARENLGTTSNCGEIMCTRTYSYIVTINIGHALVPNEYMNIRLQKNAIQDKAGNFNSNSNYSMELKKIHFDGID